MLANVLLIFKIRVSFNKGSEIMIDLWSLFLGGMTEDNMKQAFDRKLALKLTIRYTLLVLAFPASYLFLSYLVQKGIW